MDRKFLEGLGIEKENVDKIMAQYGTDVTGYQTQIGTKDATIKQLRDDVIVKDGKIAELEKVDVQELQTQLQTEKDGRAADKKEFTLRSFLQGEGCSDIDYLLYKEQKNIEFGEDGKVKDGENLAKSLRETYASQFEATEPGGTGGAGNYRRDHSGKTPEEKNPYTQKGWNLTEQMRLEVSSPDEAKKLKIEARIE